MVFNESHIYLVILFIFVISTLINLPRWVTINNVVLVIKETLKKSGVIAIVWSIEELLMFRIMGEVIRVM